ncbi:uncharacterized protein LOC111010142 [Momordica charantia]|uniref:Uncharacterized protein LOC111010142 n=1 Tax=Momordica charantia TaxID=3673 RepID=A0A6J1CD92_MOMCH|nr:uncharacterized protein LOC111010142 [Momordica charantia]
MSSPVKLVNGGNFRWVILPGSNDLLPRTISRISPPFRALNPKNVFVNQNPYIRLCHSNAGIGATDPLNSESGFSNHEMEGSMEKNESSQRHLPKSNAVLDKLRRFYIAPAPAKMGYVAAAGRFLKIMATVCAGSQVTKLARAAGALAVAPFVDRGLSWFTVKYNFESQGKAFMAIVGFCFGLALLLFIAVTLLSA